MNKDKLYSLIRNFDIISYLDSLGIAYAEEGKNVSTGWVNINCCFCNNDPSNHLGINLKTKIFNCWKCKTSTRDVGGLPGLIKELEGVNYTTALKRMEEFQENDFPLFFDEEEKEQKIKKKKHKDILPTEFRKIRKGEIPPIVKKYFRKRKFPLSYIQDYKVGWCRTGKYSYHLILPIFIDKKIVSFIAVNMKEKGYRICPNYIALKPKKELVYGLDDIVGAEQVIIVEGFSDRWRIGKDKAVSLIGTDWHIQSLLQIKKRVADNCIVKVLLDMDAYRLAEALSNNIHTLFPNTIFLQLERKDRAKDPDQLSKRQVQKILKLR